VDRQLLRRAENRRGNTGGFKVFPAEIERVIAAHPSVAMVAVGSQPDEFKGEIAKAYRC
jgi:long-chain acyl-CoA synthetase